MATILRGGQLPPLPEACQHGSKDSAGRWAACRGREF